MTIQSMFSTILLLLLLLFLLNLTAAAASAGDQVLGLEVHHRFSDRVRRWAHSKSHEFPGGGGGGGGGWPHKGTLQYYAALAAHDRSLLRRHGRQLSSSDDHDLTFADGNATYRINSLGFLHYSVVALGTPNVTFLVALDTGSDLFWVPCDCTRCASTDVNSNGFNFDFNMYSSKLSSTSREVYCNSSFCDHQTKCSGNSPCPYSIEYVSADTSSSGVLIEDLIYLTTQGTNPKVVKAPITFGCGKVQSGSFLDAAAPNGLFGLGMSKISVPSILSSAGITSNSFSMCFGNDGIGRISFGDSGSSDQQETQLNLRHSRATTAYNISIIGVSVGKSSINVDFSAIVDSGTSFTYLADPAYTSLSKSFNDQVQDKRYTDTATSSIPFEYCYYLSSNDSLNKIPDLSLTTKGGSKFPVTDPIVLVADEQQQQQSFYCLAVLKSSQLNIVGQNFLTGLRVVFDRDRMVLGWKKFNCYDVEISNSLPINPRNSSSPSPNVALGPSSYTPEATKNNGKNGTQVSVLTPGSASCHLSKLKIFTSVCLAFLLQF